MNPRVLELIKNPKNIQLEDLGLLKEEIHAFPYIQNIRALHLYGVHLYEKENYQKELSTTAAYTTDKKILYQLINGKILQESKPEIVEEKQSSKTVEKSRYVYKDKVFPIKRDEAAPEENKEEEKDTCILQPAQEVQHIYVNGERNRILFEGEENFLDEDNTETIDIESTLESGTLVTQKVEHTLEEAVKEEEEQEKIEENAGENFEPETIIDEDQIASEAVEEKVEEEVSFEETEALLPEVDVEENKVEEPKETSPEAVIENEDIQASVLEEEQIAAEPDAELSFHGTDSFMPDVKIHANNEEAIETIVAPQPNVNKHEEEMRRLIEEVEKKMKETKAAPQEESEEPEAVEDHEISFAETQSFHFWSTDQEQAEPEEVKVDAKEEEIAENQELPEEETKEEAIEADVPETQSAWKPMSLESNMPDSLISKSTKAVDSAANSPAAEISEPKKEVEEIEPAQESETIIEQSNEEISPIMEDAPEMAENQIEEIKEDEEAKIPKKEEAPVMNVSFFSTDISSLKVEAAEKEQEELAQKEAAIQEPVAESKVQSPINSNVPGFINTWQSWLKIDRTGEIEKEKTEIKEKAIEAFIENNPRISQLKEESTYVVKEKNGDISHLMTETLANLYFEQKLYTKAIKAFEILIKKNPEKKEYFETKIKDIKEFRSKN